MSTASLSEQNTGEFPPAGEKQVPLAVDMDGTLVLVDTFHESLIKLVRHRPFSVLALPGWLAEGKACFKSRVADKAIPDPALLPYSEAVLARLRQARAQGRPVILATAADRRVAQAVAGHLGMFDEVIATANGINLSGSQKRDALVKRFGEGGFDYLADAAPDLAVWDSARRVLVADAPAGVIGRIRRRHPDAKIVSPRRQRLQPLLRGMRMYQWIKNLLVFAPVIAAQRFEADILLFSLTAFALFGLAASSVYLVNDLLDLEADRRHPRKRTRPFAAGQASALHGMILAGVLLSAALAGAFLVAPSFALVLAGYLAATLAYSLWLKRFALIDIVVLAGLYTMRILAGGAATGIPLTLWLLGFSMFLFASLAFAKRYTEVAELSHLSKEKAEGRGYRAEDRHVLMTLGTACGVASVLTLALYINAVPHPDLYARVEYLWLECPLLLYWIGRIWMAAARETLTDDPIIFAVRDVGSRAVFVLALIPLAMALWL